MNLQDAAFEAAYGTFAQLPTSDLPEIAFSGRSNVGKSSLINCLLGRKKLARVSSSPGKTITVNCYRVDGKLYLVDLPGYGFARRPDSDKRRWSALTQGYFNNRESLRRVLQLIDIKVGITADDASMLEYLGYYDIPYTVVATKCDRLNKTGLSAAARSLASDIRLRPGTECILFSSETGAGREQLWQRIVACK